MCIMVIVLCEYSISFRQGLLSLLTASAPRVSLAYGTRGFAVSRLATSLARIFILAPEVSLLGRGERRA